MEQRSVSNNGVGPALKHSPRGIASFIIGVVWVPLVWLPTQLSPSPGHSDADVLTMVLLAFWLWAACPAGIILGYRGLREPGRNHSYAALGLVLNSAVLITIVIRVFLI